MKDLTAQGFRTWSNEHRDAFEDHAGPFFWRPMEGGGYEAGFEASDHHCNGHGILHGGLLMTFADYALYAFAKDHMGMGGAVTISFASEFLSAGKAGQIIRAQGAVTRATRQLIFARGMIVDAERPLLSFSGVLMKRG